MTKQEFEEFTSKLGLRSQVAEKLWEADITTPQQLGSTDRNELLKITNDPLLLNHLHPILHDNVVYMATAVNPYDTAIDIVKSHARKKSTGDSTISSDTLSGDATCYAGEPQQPDTQSQQHLAGGGSTQPGVNSILSGGGNVITISGAFTQTSILSTNTTFDNKDTTVSASLIEKLPKQDVLVVDRSNIDNANLSWRDGRNFSVANMTVPSSDLETFTRHMDDDTVYKTHGKRRALLINNMTFGGGEASQRLGADRDTENLERILKELGFTVYTESNKRAADIKELVKQFATSIENMKADMVLVYIGSHGERNEQGNDVFLGADCGRVDFGEIKDMFSPTNSPLLRDKPKIFLAQFCRKDAPPPLPEVGSDSRGVYEDPRSMDFVCVFATMAGNKAYRSVTDGSWFVMALVRVLAEHADKDDLLSMLTLVNNYVSTLKGTEEGRTAVQISEVVHSLRKKIFFYPGLM